MIAVIVGAFLLGWIHPGSKLILDQNPGVLSFVLLHFGIRLAFQIFLLPKTQAHRLPPSNKVLGALVALGLSGALLNAMEFKAINDGVPVPLVTFLLHTQPLWTLILGSLIGLSRIDRIAATQVVFALVGVFLVCNPSVTANIPVETLWAPLAAGFFLALYIVLSNFARRNGQSVWNVSFYFDGVAFLGVALGAFLFAGVEPFEGAIRFMSDPPSALSMTAYSLLIGFLPNWLVFFGSSQVSATHVALIVLLEPIVSSLTAYFLWGDFLGSTFVFGAGLILIANAPIRSFMRSRSGFSPSA